MRTPIAALLALIAGVATSLADPIQDCRVQEKHGNRDSARACWTRLAQSGNMFYRAVAFRGLKQYDAANDEFKAAYKEQPKSAAVRTEWGSLLLERFNAQQAAELFEEATKLDGKYVPAYIGLARAASESYGKAAVDFAKIALDLDSKNAEAHEVLSYLALEDNNEKFAITEAKAALSAAGDSLNAMSMLASVDLLAGRKDSDWNRKLFAINSTYGQAYETEAHFLVINRRYDEAITLYRKALALEPDRWSSRSQLGINLMRLGKAEEARTELERCYQAHFRDAQTVNALRLFDTLPDFQTLRLPNAEVLLNKKEAALLQPYVEAELARAISTYARKYRMQLPGRVRLELYPNHEDFIVRVLGLPGQGGLLGVTFDTTVAMDSPSAREPGAFNWASTLWHEMSHVYVVTATHSLVPRWFTEGLSVHEEGVVSPLWGDRVTPEILVAIRDGKLLPVLDLDRGFVRPAFPNQVLVSYYQAGKMLDFIAARWGDDAILGMIHSFADGKNTETVIREGLHLEPAAFDRDFAGWLKGQTDLAARSIDNWRAEMRAAAEASKAGNWDVVIAKAKAANEIYPDYAGLSSGYQLLAEAYKSKKDAGAQMRALTAFRDHGGTDVESLKTLAELQIAAGRTDDASRTLQEMIYVYPEDETTHLRWGQVLLDRKENAAAVREYRAALALKPSDPVEVHYRLATALHESGQDADAKDEVLAALEDAPRFRPAQRLLLQLVPQN